MEEGQLAHEDTQQLLCMMNQARLKCYRAQTNAILTRLPEVPVTADTFLNDRKDISHSLQL